MESGFGILQILSVRWVLRTRSDSTYKTIHTLIRLSTLWLILWLLLLIPEQGTVPKERRLLIWLILLWLRVAKCSKCWLGGITLTAEYRRFKVRGSYRVRNQIKKRVSKSVIPNGEGLLVDCVFPKTPKFCEGCWDCCCWVFPNAEEVLPPKILVVPPPIITTLARKISTWKVNAYLPQRKGWTRVWVHYCQKLMFHHLMHWSAVVGAARTRFRLQRDFVVVAAAAVVTDQRHHPQINYQYSWSMAGWGVGQMRQKLYWEW